MGRQQRDQHAGHRLLLLLGVAAAHHLPRQVHKADVAAVVGQACGGDKDAAVLGMMQ